MLNQKIKIAFWGSSDFSVIAVDELKKLGVIPELVITTPDKPQGRKMILTPTPVKTWAIENSIECLTPPRLKDPEFLEKIKEYNLMIVASYGKIIPQEVIDIPKYKILNIHPSLLPKYRGASPLQNQILNDEKDVGVSIMQVDIEMDHGPIIKQKKVGINNWPVGFVALQENLAREGARIISEILPEWIKGKIEPREQTHTEATFTKKIEKLDGLIDITNGDKYKNYLKILALGEWPRAYFYTEKKGVKTRVIIKSATWKDGALEILKVIPEGKKEMDYKSFLLGL